MQEQATVEVGVDQEEAHVWYSGRRGEDASNDFHYYDNDSDIIIQSSECYFYHDSCIGGEIHAGEGRHYRYNIIIISGEEKQQQQQQSPPPPIIIIIIDQIQIEHDGNQEKVNDDD